MDSAEAGVSRRYGKRQVEKERQRNTVLSGQSCRSSWLRDLSDGRFHGRRERQFTRSLGHIISFPIAVSHLHSRSALSVSSRLHDAFRALLLHLYGIRSAGLHDKRSAFPSTSNRFKADNRQF